MAIIRHANIPLKFEDCKDCSLRKSVTCFDCDAGEYFEEDDARMDANSGRGPNIEDLFDDYD